MEVGLIGKRIIVSLERLLILIAPVGGSCCTLLVVELSGGVTTLVVAGCTNTP
jgi:hypothetical protein